MNFPFILGNVCILNAFNDRKKSLTLFSSFLHHRSSPTYYIGLLTHFTEKIELILPKKRENMERKSDDLHLFPVAQAKLSQSTLSSHGINFFSLTNAFFTCQLQWLRKREIRRRRVVRKSWKCRRFHGDAHDTSQNSRCTDAVTTEQRKSSLTIKTLKSPYFISSSSLHHSTFHCKQN